MTDNEIAKASHEKQKGSTTMPRNTAPATGTAPDAHETALAADYRQARSRRLSTYAMQANAKNVAQYEELRSWTDPVLLERVAIAKRTVELANLELLRTSRRLYAKHSAERDRQRKIAGANNVPLPGSSLPGVDPIASRMTDDPEWKLAQATVVKAKRALLEAGRAAVRSARSRASELANLEREVRLRRARPTEDELLERITGNGKTNLETELALRRLLRKDEEPSVYETRGVILV